jgi:hypothetical protein
MLDIDTMILFIVFNIAGTLTTWEPHLRPMRSHSLTASYISYVYGIISLYLIIKVLWWVLAVIPSRAERLKGSDRARAIDEDT